MLNEKPRDRGRAILTRYLDFSQINSTFSHQHSAFLDHPVSLNVIRCLTEPFVFAPVSSI
jgi:hypothetical protein